MRAFVILAFLAVFACAAHAQDAAESLAATAVQPAVIVDSSVGEPDTAEVSLLAVDAGAQHSNESPREARQFGFGGGYYRPYPYYGGGFGGGFYGPRPYYGGGFYGGYRPYPYYGGYRGGFYG